MLVECLLNSVSRFPDKIAAADPLQKLSYAQLVTLSRVIHRIVSGETQQERVGLMLPASATGLASLFGVLWTGKQIVPLNFLLQARELQAIIADAQLDLILSTVHFRPLLEQIAVRALYVEDLGLGQQLASESIRPVPTLPKVDPHDTACILYTSGTTGQPKGVCLTHDNILSNARSAARGMRLTPDDHFLGVLPPFHVFGLSVLNFLPVILGARATYLPRFSPQGMYRAAQEDRPTVLLAVPSMYGVLARLKDLDPKVFAAVNIAASGGEPLPRTVYNLVGERMGITLVEGYGMTETSPIISVDLPWAHRVGTVGPALDGIEIELRDDQGKALTLPGATGQPTLPGAARAEALGSLVNSLSTPPIEGELHVRGSLVMKGYYRQPEDTSRVIDAQGWLRTGDIVRLDPDGYLSITGRAKDLIIVAGENVYPREVENVLEEHPAVAEAAVVGRQDGSRGEVVVAFVTLRPDRQTREDELRSFCRERLASFKTPREVHIRGDFPRGPTGKILKRQLSATAPM